MWLSARSSHTSQTRRAVVTVDTSIQVNRAEDPSSNSPSIEAARGHFSAQPHPYLIWTKGNVDEKGLSYYISSVSTSALRARTVPLTRTDARPAADCMVTVGHSGTS